MRSITRVLVGLCALTILAAPVFAEEPGVSSDSGETSATSASGMPTESTADAGGGGDLLPPNAKAGDVMPACIRRRSIRPSRRGS
jgi:hypothetical protein